MMMMMMMMKWGGKIYRTSLSPRSQTNNLFTLKIRVGSVCKQTCYLYDPLSSRFNCSIERSKEIDKNRNKRGRRRKNMQEERHGIATLNKNTVEAKSKSVYQD